MKFKQILIVDDEEQILDLFGQFLCEEGYEVLTANSAEAALDILAKESCHVMLIDINLPGMDGIELCRQIREKNSIDIIFAITGYASTFHLDTCRKAGFDDYFTKPISLTKLMEEVQHAFRCIDRWTAS